MKYLPLCLLLVAGVFLSACHNGPPTGPTDVAGSYRSSIYILPGPADGPDSMHLRGAFVEVALKANGTLNGRSSYPIWGTPNDTITFTGTYTTRNDSVFMDTDSLSVLEMAGWKYTGDHLVLQRRGIGPTSIYLKRQ